MMRHCICVQKSSGCSPAQQN
jgi:hypothetical protein